MGEHEEVFALLDLPFVPLFHVLGLLPHTSLLPLAASCKHLHTIVHSSPSLWRRLLLKPSMLTCTGATQSFILALKKHGNSVTAVKVKYSEEDGYLEHMQQLLAFVAASCPAVNHVSLPYLTTYDFPPTNQLKLLVSSFPHITSLTIKMYESSKGLEELAKLSKLKQLHLIFFNDRESQKKLRTVFSSLGELRKVTIGAGGFHTSTPGEFFGKQFSYNVNCELLIEVLLLQYKYIPFPQVLHLRFS